MGEPTAPNQKDHRADGSTNDAHGLTGAAAMVDAALRGTRAHRFDVFLSHNSLDKPTVVRVAQKLREAGLEPWLDRWYLTGGGVWQEDLAAALRASATCAIFIGPHGFGDWAREELLVAQERAAKGRAFRLIPVLLPGLPDPFEPSGVLPPFLLSRMWVDLRAGIEDPAGFQRLVSAITGVPVGPVDLLQPQDQTPPYRGLRHFEEKHAAFFFGRAADVQRLLEKLKGTRFLAVLGPSGGGKSSLTRAGLVPALRGGGLAGSSTWPIHLLTPGARPLEGLAISLAGLSASTDPLGAARQFREHLWEDQQALHLAIRLAQDRSGGTRTVFVLDQFEEVFTLCHDEAERKQFLDNLLFAATVPDGRCVVILTLRADFYPRCAAYPELASQAGTHQYLVSPMSTDSLRQAIEEPAHRVGLDFEAGLVDAILEDVAEQPGGLPLLEHTLWELWQRRRGRLFTLEAYRDTGGVAGALAKRADEIYDQFSPEQQTVARRILLRLTEPGEGTEDTRRRASINEFASRADESLTIEEVVEALVDARLLTTSADERTGEQTVDVAHEALIRGWPRLRDWLDEDRAGLRVHRRLTDAALEWDQANRDEGLLYRGARLVEAVEWRAHNESALNAFERAFLNASVALQDKEHHAARARTRFRLRAMGAIALLTIVLLGTALWSVTRDAESQRQLANQQTVAAATAQALAASEITARATAEAERQRADQQARFSLSRQLVVQSQNHLNDQLDLALLLSRQAYQTLDTAETRGALLRALEFNPALITFLRGHTDSVSSVAFSPDGKTLASGGGDRTLRLWDVTTRQPLGDPLTGHTDAVWSVAFSPDGKTLASGSYDDTVRLWDVTTHQSLSDPLTGHTNYVSSVAFSRDGKTLASGTHDGTVRLWDATTRQLVGDPLTSPNGSYSVAFSPDGKTLASGTDVYTVRLWDVASRLPLGDPLTGHTGSVSSVAFSPDGKILASGSYDNTVRLWDVTTRQPLGDPLTGHTDAVWSVAFSPDGKTLASGSSDRTVRLWEISMDSWLDHACRLANRNLTFAEWAQFIGSQTPYERTCPDLRSGT